MTEVKNKPSFAHRIFNPIETIKSDERNSKKIGLVALSIFIGIFSAFIPHLIYWWLHREITVLKPDRTSPKEELTPSVQDSDIPLLDEEGDEEDFSKTHRKRIFERVDLLGERHIPKVSTAFADKPKYGDKAQFLGHVTGHQVVSGTSLEGSTHQKILAHTLEFLEKRGQTNLSQNASQAVEKMKVAKELSEIESLEDFKRTIQTRLIEKDSLLVPFGWRGAPSGHAMYLEVLDKDKTHCTVRIFNLGAGGKYHMHSDHKQMPFLDWKGVEIEKFTSDNFLQAIFELNHNAETPEGNRTNYSEDDIYLSCKELLDPKDEKTKLSEGESPLERWMAPQETGICAWKSLAAFLSTYLTKAEYKELMADIKIDAIYEFTKGNSQNQTKESRRLFKRSLSSTASYINKQIQQGNIEEKYYKIAFDKLNDAKNSWIQGKGEIGGRMSPQKSLLQYKANPILIYDFFKASKEMRPSLGIGALSPVRPKSIETLENIRALKGIPLNERFKELLELFEKDKNLWKEEGLAIHQGLLEFMLELPLDQEAWKKGVSASQARILLTQTLKLSEIAFGSWFGNPGASIMQPEHIHTFRKLVDIQQSLTKIAFGLDKGRLFNPFPYEKESALSPWDSTFDSALIKERASIEEKERLEEKGISFSIPKSDLKELPKSPFWITLKKEYPKYVQSLEEKYNESESNLVIKALTDKELPEPLRASRNGSLFLSAVLTSPNLSTPSGLANFSSPFDFQPEIKVENGTYNIKILTQISGCKEENTFKLADLGGLIEERPYAILEKKYLANVYWIKETQIQPKSFPEEGLNLCATEELRLLLRAFASKETAHNDLLVYCKEHPGAIFEKDFQRLFIRGLLKKEASPQLLHLQDWLKEQLTGLIRTRSDEMETACFLLRAIRYTDWIASSDHQVSEEHLEHIQALKSRAEDTPLQRQIFLEELTCLSKKKDLKEEELLTLAKEICTLNHNPLHTGDVDPLWLFEIGKANLRVAKPLAEFIEKDPSQINKVLKVLDKETKELTWEKRGEGKFIAKETGDTFYSLSPRFEISKLDSQEVFISQKIIENPDFRKLFPSIMKAKLIQTKEACYYEFLDPSTSRITQVTLDGEISQKIEDAFWIWTPAEELYKKESDELPPQCALGSGPLTFRYHHFRLRDSYKMISEDPKTHQILYRGTFEQGTLAINNEQNKWRLSSPSPIFEALTHPLAIQEWYDEEGVLQKCELPTLGLNFRRRGDFLDCKELPGFYLDLTKPKASVIPNCPLGIVLENEKGEKKLLLPQLESIKPPKNEKESLIPHFEIEFSFESARLGECKYHIYDLSEKNALTTNNSASELYLASIYSLFKQYKKAFEILKKHRGQLRSLEKESAFLNSLQRIIEVGTTTGDQTPHAVALSLFTSLLLLKNSLTYPDDKNSISLNLKTLSDNYRKFIKKEHHIYAVSLLKEEELFLIDYLDPEGKNALFQERKAFLQEKPKKILIEKAKEDPLESPSKTIDFASALLSLPTQSPFDSSICKNNLITRPCFSSHIESYYFVARKGTLEQKKWLEAAIAFAKHDEKESGSARFLKLVMNHPKHFTDWKDNVKWTLDMGRLLEGLSKANPENLKSSLAPEVDSKNPFPFSNLKKAIEPILGPLSFAITQKNESLANLIEKDTIKESRERSIPSSFNTFLEKGKTALSPLEKSEYERLSKDALEYKKGKEQIFRITNIEGFKAAIEEKGENGELSRLKNEILQIANAIPDNDPKLQLLKLQGQIKPFALEELLINFARQKPEALRANNPALSKESIENLYSKLGEYLIVGTSLQQKERVKKALSKNLPEEAASLALAKRAYAIDPADKKTLAYLTFEYFSDLLLRPEQVTLQKNFLENLEECYAQEMIMGSGKSKVILILLALLRADGKNISTLVVASPFFKDVALHSSDILQKTFGQTLATIHFDRGTPLTLPSLNAVLDTLESVKKNQDCLIVTSKTLQCLTLRFIEEWLRFSESGKENPSDELELLKTILVKIHKEGNLLIDELDTVLNVLHTVSFSLGKKERPKPALLKINQAIYEILYCDPNLKQLAQLESDPEPNLKAPPLTKELYQNLIRAPLAKKFLEKMSALEFEKKEDQEALLEIGKCNQEALADFICQDPELEKKRAVQANLAYNSLSDAARELVSEAALEVGHLLASTLTKTSKEKYGIPKGSRFAIPYSAANTPCMGSDFANHTVIFNYTLQFTAKYDLELTQIKKPLEEAMKRLEKEPEESEGGPSILISKWEKKLKLRFSQKKTNWKAVQKKLNENFLLKLEFLSDFIVPNLEFYSEKITSNSQNIAEFAELMKGFTGTLWNAKTFHNKFAAQHEMGTDSKTLALLFNHSNKTALEFESLDESWDMLIDAGGYFKKEENLVLARAYANSRKMPVVFYHNKAQTVTDGVQEKPFKEASLKEGEYLTFLDQVNTTGADIAQKPNAKGFVTIKAGMLKRDLLQAAWRLRGLAKGQTIDWVLDKKTASLIRAALDLSEKDPIGLSEILRYTIANEAEQLAMDNYQACLQQIENVKQQIFIQELKSNNSVEDKKKSIDALKSSFCKPESASTPSKQFCKLPEMIDTKDYLDDLEKRIALEINSLPISNASKEGALKDISAIVKRYKAPGMLLGKIQSPQAIADESVEVEKESQQEEEVEVEVVKDQKNEKVELEHESEGEKLIPIKIYKNGTLGDYRYQSTRYISLARYFEYHPKFQTLGIEKAFEEIHTTLNFLQKNRHEEELIQNYHLHETYQKEFDYVIFSNDGAVLISQEDAANYLKNDNMFSIKSGEFLNLEKSLTPKEFEQVLIIKFLAGISKYSEEELEFLEKWIKKSPQLIEFFKSVVLKKNRLRAAEFRGSPLSKLFSKLQPNKNTSK